MTDDRTPSTEAALNDWYRRVRQDWLRYWQGSDHRYGQDFAAFVGERLRTDFRLEGPNTTALDASEVRHD